MNARAAFVALTATAWMIVGGATALAWWSATTTHAQGSALHAAADALPQGSAPVSTSADVPGGTTVHIRFQRAVTLVGGVAVDEYELRRLADGDSAGVVASASCQVDGAWVDCVEHGTPDGHWRYVDVPRFGATWRGLPSDPGPRVTVDSTAPDITVSTPIDGDAYNDVTWTVAGGAFQGTASDATSGIASATSIAITITRLASGQSWSGSAFIDGDNSVAPTSWNASTGRWSYEFPAGSFPVDGWYSVRAAATDASGNSATTPDTSFVIDNDLAVAATFPTEGAAYNAASWQAAGPVAGYATSVASVVSSVAVSVQLGDDPLACWTGSLAGFTAACPNFLATTGTPSAWSFAIAPSSFPDDGAYSIKVRAIDAIGTVEMATRRFAYDTRPPALTLGSPANGAWLASTQVHLSGQAGTQPGDGAHGADDGSVSVVVHAGSSDAGAVVSSLASTVADGTWSVTTAALAPGSTYTAVASQNDSAGNVARAQSTFVIDTTAPTVAVLSPVDASTVTSSTPAISGTASTAAAGAGSSADGQVVTIDLHAGTTVGGPIVQSIPVMRSGGTWVATPAALPAGRYTVQASQRDGAGNVGVSSPVTFTVALGPAVAITFPPDGTWYSGGASGWNATHGTCAARTICGTTVVSYGQVTGVWLQLRDTSSGLCWNGKTNNTAAFASSCTSSTGVAGGYFAATSASGSWATWTLLAPNANQLVDGRYYAISVRATDAAGTTSAASGFGYDTTAPSLTGVHVVNADTGGLDEVQPSHGFIIVATVTDASSGMASVAANASALDGIATDTSVPLTACSVCTARGISFNVASARLVSTATTGPKNITVTASDRSQSANSASSGNVGVQVDATAPTVKSVLTSNHAGGIVGRPEAADAIAITFSSLLAVPSICGSWTLADSVPGVVSSSATVAITSGTTDTLTITSAGCTLHVGTMNLGAGGFVAGGIGSVLTFAGSAVTWDGISKVTITLGSQVGGTGVAGTVSTATTATYTPDGAITDVAGNRVTGTATTGGRVQF